MLGDNIKNLRKAKGLSQEELAIKLNVVRQTVSKWEKGLSVPDSGMLIDIAENLETTVNVLLDEEVKPDINSELSVIANKLEVLNGQIARQNENRRKILRVISVVVFILAVCFTIGSTVNFLYLQTAMNSIGSNTAVIGGADGPTSIFVVNGSLRILPFVFAAVTAIISFAGIYKTRKKSVS